MVRRLIAIDGPAGCGKSTVARELARELDGLSFSTGAVYRAVTLLALDAGVQLERPPEVLRLLAMHELEVVERDHELKLTIDGRDRERELHGSAVSREIHWIADAAEIRARLLPLQRALAAREYVRPGPLVFEGRDVGTVVFPDAGVKVFLTATAEERARRRQKQLRAQHGEELSVERVLSDVERRDRFDQERDAAPLAAAAGAKILDTSGRSVAEVVASILKGLPPAWRAPTQP